MIKISSILRPEAARSIAVWPEATGSPNLLHTQIKLSLKFKQCSMDAYTMLFLIFLVPTIIVLFARLGLAKLGWQRGPVFHWTLGIVLGLALLVATISSILILKFDIYPPGYRAGSWIVIGAGAVIFLASILWQSHSTFLGLIWICCGGFVAGVSIVLAWEVIDDGPKQLFYDDDRFRIENTSRLMGPNRYKLFEKHGFYERGYDFGESSYPGYHFHQLNTAQIEIFEQASGYRVEWTMRESDQSLEAGHTVVVEIPR
jgi:hypothetical protein